MRWKASGVTFSKGRESVGTGVVDENVEPAEHLFRLGKKPLDVRLFRHVRLHGDGPAAACGDFTDDAVSRFFAR